jgi:phospholipase C
VIRTFAVLAVLLSAVPSFAAPAPKPAFRPFKKIMIVIFENKNYEDAVKAPFFKSFAERGALLTDYHGVAHPSQPNYVALAAGDTMGVIDDAHYDLDGPSVADLLEKKGLTWGVYAEGLHGTCARDDMQDLYRRKHEPFISFKAIRKDPKRCANIKPASALDADLRAGRLPDFSLFVPDMNDDGHDTTLAYADKWFARRFGPLLKDRKFMAETAVAVVFDEDEKREENHIYAALAGAGVEPGARSAERCDHYSLLRTVEDAFGLGTLGRHDARAARIRGIWRKK